MTKLLTIGSLLGALAVGAGAFGAHVLRDALGPNSLNAFHKAVNYQFYHAIFLVLVSYLYSQKPHKLLKSAAYCALSGIICFSGSLYVLSTYTLYLRVKPFYLGPVTPIGGILFMIAWVLLAIWGLGISKKVET
ncbi:hypothetical protein BVY03_02185 [bacterium K02(2017)]|nr:hypothetical protein BVY03_02185 [bacterium K02(2017)]